MSISPGSDTASNGAAAEARDHDGPVPLTHNSGDESDQNVSVF